MIPRIHITEFVVLAVALWMPVSAPVLAAEPERSVIVSTSAPNSPVVTGLGATELSTAPTEPTPDAVRIDLHTAVLRALTRNKTLAVTKLNPHIATAQVKIQQGAFDDVFTSTIEHQHAVTPTGSALEGAAVSESFTTLDNYALTKKLRDGATVSVTYNNTRLQTNSTFQSLNPQFTSNLIYQITQPLARGFGRFTNTANLRIAINGVRQADLLLRQQVITTVANVERDYWELVFARANRDVVRFALAAALELQAFNERRMQVGVGSEVDVITAKASAAQQQSNLEQAQRVIGDDEEQLRQDASLDGTPPGLELFPTDALPELPPPAGLAKALQTAYERRPDYRQQIIQIRNAQINTKFLKNQELPQVNLLANFANNGVSGSQASAVNQVDSGQFASYTVGFLVSVPLENRTARGNTRNGKLLERQAVLNVKAAQDQINHDVTTAVRELNTDLQAVKVAKNAEALAVEQLRAAEARFREGLLSNIDLLIFQQQLATARSTTIRAMVNAVKDGITVEADTGILLDTRRIVLDDYQRIPKDVEGPVQHPVIEDDSNG